MKRFLKFAKKALLITAVIIIVVFIYFVLAIRQSTPKIVDGRSLDLKRENPSKDFYTIGKNWFKKSETGLWELYLEGDGFERGVINGKLTKELAEKQEQAFIKQIQLLIPSPSYLNFLKYFVAYFNRHLPDHITEEYLQEIYGVSLFASDIFDEMAPKYYRILNYHGAHDIGHALQDKNITVGCTSFGVWNSKTSDGKLLIGRNFDFYSGDEFAETKIVAFVKPTSGHKYMYITWPGFTGVVSGMNEKGMTVTINAAKSDIPTDAATPISLLAKEILQYATNSKEAYAIAEKRKTFVSESILIGSASENKSFIIEKTPTRINLYQETRDQLVSPNHYLSDYFSKDLSNNKNIYESSSCYRKVRMEQLINDSKKHTPSSVAAILRNTKGLNNTNIGLGNEKSINQLIAHHGVIFKPADGLVWVSAPPFQLGSFVCYDLKKIFGKEFALSNNEEIYDKQNSLKSDDFIQSKEYANFILFKKIKLYIDYCTKSEFSINVDENLINAFIESNKESYFTYWIIGDYYKKMKLNENAIKNYKIALTKVVATNKEANYIKKTIVELEKK